MLPKTERLDRAKFSDFFAKGRRVHGTYTTLVLSPSDDFISSVVVGKKVAKLAHERNRIRRRIYSLLRTIKVEVNPKLALIVIVKPAITKLSKADFVKEVEVEIVRALNKR